MAVTTSGWDEFGPEGQTEGNRLATNLGCERCDVQWHEAEGWDCWLCGRKGSRLRQAHYVYCGMDVRFVENNPGPVEVG